MFLVDGGKYKTVPTLVLLVILLHGTTMHIQVQGTNNSLKNLTGKCLLRQQTVCTGIANRTVHQGGQSNVTNLFFVFM